MATYDLANTTPTKLKTGDIINCSYSGSVKSITLPEGTYKLECWGAQGGSYNTTYAVGGKGGYSVGTITLKDKSTPLYLYVGGYGSYSSSSSMTTKAGGGFNGGGNASYRGGGGGGASDIRIGQDSLYARVIVAGGGGGAYAYSSTYKAAGGNGGGTSGSAGSRYSTSYSYQGQGGTATAGGASNSGVTSGNYNGAAGSFGIGGDSGSAYSTSYYSGGGGGGGWYGGSGADGPDIASRNVGAGGGGGSGYVYTSSTASQYPSGCLLNSSYYLTSASTTAGQKSSNGQITITVVELKKGIEGFRIKTSDTKWSNIISGWIKINSTTWKELNAGFVFIPGTSSSTYVYKKVQQFQNGKDYVLLLNYNNAYYYLGGEKLNDYTIKAIAIPEVTSANDTLNFSTTPTLYTATASGDGFTLKTGDNFLYGQASSGSTSLTLNTSNSTVYTIDTSVNGGFDSDEIIARVDDKAVWIRSNLSNQNCSLKYESGNTSVGIDYKDRNTQYSTGFISFILYEKTEIVNQNGTPTPVGAATS